LDLGGSNLNADLFSHLQVFSRIPERVPTGSWRSSPEAAERARKPTYRETVLAGQIATLIALDARARKIADVKAVFPGAEIVGRSFDPNDRPGEGLK
jgi:hypothetical protein